MPFFDERGNFLGYRNLGSDVTEQVRNEQRAREADERLRAAIDDLAETVVICDAGDRIVLANRHVIACNAGIAETLEPGRRFEDHLRAAVAAGYIADAIGREAEWVAERLERRRKLSGPFEIRYADGRWILIHERRLGDGGIITVGHDITATKRGEAVRLEEARRQRDALVREVHHRIKNSLQGVTGLLQTRIARSPELEEALRAAISQIQVIAKVHGLHGRGADDVRLEPLLLEILFTLRTISAADIRYEPQGEARWALAEGEAVPVALVINELVWNAVKHRARADAGVAVGLQAWREGVRLVVENPGAFAPAGGQGAGLALARTLLPGAGGRLEVRGAGGVVRAELELRPPAVRALAA